MTVAGCSSRRRSPSCSTSTLFAPRDAGRWRAGAGRRASTAVQRWQRELWLALFGRADVFAPDAALDPARLLARTPAAASRPPAASAHVFGISFVARLYRSIFAALGRAHRCTSMRPNPCREYWEDLSRRGASDPSGASRGGAAKRSWRCSTAPATAVEPARGRGADRRPRPAARAVGAAGARQHPAANQLSECDFDARFVGRRPTPRPPDAAGDPAAGGARSRAARSEAGDRRRQPGACSPRPIRGASWRRRRGDLGAAARRQRRRQRRGRAGMPLRFRRLRGRSSPAASAATYLPLAREVFTRRPSSPHTVLDLPSPPRATCSRPSSWCWRCPPASWPPRSAAAGDAPGRRAPLPRRRSRGLSWRWRGARHRARRRPARSRGQLPRPRTGSAGTRGCSGWRWGVSLGRAAARSGRSRSTASRAGGGAAGRRSSRRRARWAMICAR